MSHIFIKLIIKNIILNIQTFRAKWRKAERLKDDLKRKNDTEQRDINTKVTVIKIAQLKIILVTFSYSLFVYFGNKSSEGAERLRGLTLSLRTFISFLGYIIYFYNPVSVPQEESGQKRQKSGLGQKCQRRLCEKYGILGDKYRHIHIFPNLDLWVAENWILQKSVTF
jgi:hypothetical protein